MFVLLFGTWIGALHVDSTPASWTLRIVFDLNLSTVASLLAKSHKNLKEQLTSCWRMKTWLVLTLARSQASLQTQREEWWAAGHTQMNVWDHSWLTPRLVCGFRFMRVPPGISLDKGIFLPITVGSEESANQSGQVPVAEKLMLWTFDGTGFQDRAVQYFAGGVPPMEDVWLLALVAAVPATFTSNVMSGSDMMELQCAAMVLLSSYIYAEYMAMLVPPAVLLKYFQHTWEVLVKDTLQVIQTLVSFNRQNRVFGRFRRQDPRFTHREVDGRSTPAPARWNLPARCWCTSPPLSPWKGRCSGFRGSWKREGRPSRVPSRRLGKSRRSPLTPVWGLGDLKDSVGPLFFCQSNVRNSKGFPFHFEWQEVTAFDFLGPLAAEDDDCPPAAAPFGGTPVTRPLVDVVVTRCAEDLSWLAAWLARILRDEWTPEVAGMRVRLVIYEKCPSGASKNQELDGQQLLDWMLRLGVVHPGLAFLFSLHFFLCCHVHRFVMPGSTAIELTEPEGFENVAYVQLGQTSTASFCLMRSLCRHYCMTAKWRDSDFVRGSHFACYAFFSQSPR